MATIKTASKDTIREAAEILRAGGIVAMPTETVYGLAGNALDGAAVARIFEAKGRPQFNPLITHIADAKDAEKYVELDERARSLIAQFWPGPLTLVLPRRKDCPISELVTAGLETMAIRMPAHKTARALLRQCGLPLAAPSANRSGEISPTTPAHVAGSLGEHVDMILADGSCTVGIESTVLDLTASTPTILRPGAITAEDISAILGCAVPYAHEITDTPKSPGQLLKHYAPSIPVRLNAVDVRDGEALLAFGSIKFMGRTSGGFAKDLPDTMRRNLSETGNLNEAAANLFAMMKALDSPSHTAIAVMNIPDTGLGVAINDRLRRAASSRNMEP